MKLDELAQLRGIDPQKYIVGLGCHEFALCPEGWDAATLGVGAARRALSRWRGDLGDIGLIAVGTETAKDMSRPLSAFIAEELGLAGAVRSYEVKHACYGQTLALRQAIEWRLSGASRGKAALVIGTDVGLYEPASPGEPTQGAGAVAFVVAEPAIATVDLESYAYSEPAFDFWRPVGELYPRVDGKFSLDCYMKATVECFRQLVGDRDPDALLDSFAALCFHVPFPKMVWKAVKQLGEAFAWSPEKTAAFFAARVDPALDWNRRVGNCYTASLWLSVAQRLRGCRVGDRMAAFSYGSGFGAELLTLTAGELAEAGEWSSDVDTDLAARRYLDGAGYLALREA